MSLKMTKAAASSKALTEKQRFFLHCKAIWEKKWKELSKAKVSVKEQLRYDACSLLFSELKLTSGARVVDLGCGTGHLLTQIYRPEYFFEGVDISSLALKRVKERGVKLHEECVPFTRLADGGYDVVLCTEMIGEFKRTYQRLLLSECARLLKGGGSMIFSTRLDIDSIRPFEELLELLSTEFEVGKTHYFFHTYHERLCRWFPFFENRKGMVKVLERCCKSVKGAEGVSEVVCVTQKKRLVKKKKAGDYLKAWN